MEAYDILMENKTQLSWGVFYVVPQIAAFCLELYTKTLVAFKITPFDGKKYSHKTTNLLVDYKDKVPFLRFITDDNELMKLIKEYENTIDTKYAETYVQSDSEDRQKIIDSAMKIRQEILKLTGLKN